MDIVWPKGGLAQLAERPLRMRKVAGSIPAISMTWKHDLLLPENINATKFLKAYWLCRNLFCPQRLSMHMSYSRKANLPVEALWVQMCLESILRMFSSLVVTKDYYKALNKIYTFIEPLRKVFGSIPPISKQRL